MGKKEIYEKAIVYLRAKRAYFWRTVAPASQKQIPQNWEDINQ